MSTFWWVLGAAIFLPALGVVAFMFWRKARQAAEEANLVNARAEFKRQREWLEARFFSMASESGKPRGLSWQNCDFASDVAFARDRASGELRALTSVSIRFEAVEGGGMEDNPNVGNIRSATAVFLHRNNHWETDGRAIMNLSPHQAIDHFRRELEVVE